MLKVNVMSHHHKSKKNNNNKSRYLVQLRDPKNDFIFNFNFDDKMKIFEQFEFRTK